MPWQRDLCDLVIVRHRRRSCFADSRCRLAVSAGANSRCVLTQIDDELWLAVGVRIRVDVFKLGQT